MRPGHLAGWIKDRRNLTLLVDTHCHLNLEAFSGDYDQVVQQAREAGVQKILVPGINLVSSQKAMALAQAYQGIFAAVGIHPNDLEGFDIQDLDALRNLARDQHVVAIGEIGLDYYWKTIPPERQKELFQAQLALAKELELPVVIHGRDEDGNQTCMQDLFTLLESWVGELPQDAQRLRACPGVLHSFAGSREWAEAFTSLNFLIGISGPVTYKNARELHALVQMIPLTQLVVETDAPFLPPQPHRGERNQPAFVRYMAARIAEIRGEPYETVALVTTKNAGRLFAW